ALPSQLDDALALRRGEEDPMEDPRRACGSSRCRRRVRRSLRRAAGQDDDRTCEKETFHSARCIIRPSSRLGNGGVPKWLRERTANPRCGGSNPPAASIFHVASDSVLEDWGGVAKPGSRRGLKILCPQGRAGSNPAAPTTR